MLDFKSSIFGNWFFLIFLALFFVFSFSFFYDYKALSSNINIVCGKYLEDELVSVGGSRPNKIEYLKILPEGDSASIYFKKNLSLSKIFLLWVKGSKVNEYLSKMKLGNQYCVTFSIDYKEDLDPIFKPVPYLINIERSMKK